MGIVRRQSFWSTLAAYTGSGFGYLNWGLLLPNLLSLQYFGLLKLVYDVSYFFAGFAHLGVYPTITKFYPYAKTDDRKNSGLLSYALLHGAAGALVFLAVIWGFSSPIIDIYDKKSPLFGEYFWYVVPLTMYYIFFGLLYTYCFSFFKSVFPNYIKDVILRIFILMPIGMLYYYQWDFDRFIRVFTGVHFISLAMLVYYIYYLGYFKLSPPAELFSKIKFTEISKYSASNLLIGSGGIMLKYIDTIMISAMLGLGATAIYGLAFMIAAVIEQPKQALFKVTVPIAADYWKKQEWNKINELYQKTSLNLMIVGLSMAILIAVNMRDIYTFLPADYAQGYEVVMIILAAKCMYMTFGMTDELIQISDFYSFRFISAVIVFGLVVVSNYILIPMMGIEGASLGSLLAMTLQQTMLWAYLYIKLKLKPFGIRHLKASAICLATGIPFLFINFGETPPIISIIIRSIALVGMLLFFLYFTKASDEIHSTINMLIIKIKRQQN